ncbi:MAG TPA: L-threonylcarbamoyladenylate synthase [Candidatus Methylomirabilis sp.]|nr:L-threonylcarbamoyladenylate synthase [Candidatus Methylomirabilis sp.]
MLTIDSDTPSGEVLALAATILRDGGLVAFPTESFYGLGADALMPRALDRVFSVKGRPESKPLLVLVDSVTMTESLASDVPARARDLMTRHWPGALTLVLRAAAHVPDRLTGGTGTIGVRMPAHPVALGLVRALQRAVTAPSANPSGAPPPTTAGAVRDYFDGSVDLILDGGPTAGGAGSTIADCTEWPPRIVRQGPVTL